MSPRIRGLASGTALLLAAACGRPEEARTAGGVYAMTPVDHAVAAAPAIQANPGSTDSILAAHGLTRARFDALMYEVAVDSALARAYTEAIR